MDEQPLQTNIPDLLDYELDDLELEDMAPEVVLMLTSLERPRANLGSSGPPGRVD